VVISVVDLFPDMSQYIPFSGKHLGFSTAPSKTSFPGNMRILQLSLTSISSKINFIKILNIEGLLCVPLNLYNYQKSIRLIPKMCKLTPVLYMQ